MGKTKKDEYWKHIRLPVAPPVKVFKSSKDYDRKRKINPEEYEEYEDD